MTATLDILEAGPSVTIQDLGRPGYVAQGLTRGGAMDRLALYEAAALLSQPVTAALEMIGFGGSFRVSEDVRITLTGATMAAEIDGTPVPWNSSAILRAGEVLKLGGVRKGAVGYLTFGGGIATPMMLDAQSAHLAASLGRALQGGDSLPLGSDAGGPTDLVLAPSDRFEGGEIGIVTTAQSHHFGNEELQRFATTRFNRDARANRQGIRMNPDGEGFAAKGGLSVVSEIIVPGDIQIIGDGAPYVLMCESQTTGGYPRIASVLPSDLPRVAQAPLGAEIRFRLLSLDEAVARETAARAEIKRLPSRAQPRHRNPADMADLLSYNLVSGAISATADPFVGELT